MKSSRRISPGCTGASLIFFSAISVEKLSAGLARGGEFPRIVRSRNRRIHQLVLLRTTAGLQPDRVLRYRFLLEQNNLAPSTINVRLAAVRRLAYEAADTGLLSPELAAGIRRVKGAKRLGVRIGNWLTADQKKALLRASPSETVRDRKST